MRKSNKIIEPSLIKTWQIFLANPVYRFYTATIMSLVLIVLFFTSKILLYAEGRKGSIIYDPILNLFEPVDLTYVIFAFLWVVIVAGVAKLAFTPKQLLLFFHGYIWMLLLRMTAIYALPMEAPPLTIPLASPVVQIATQGKIMTKDLFFSGHTATMFLLYITAIDKRDQFAFFLATIMMAFFVVIQHVHYTIDVLAAPFFAYGCYRFAGFLSVYINRWAKKYSDQTLEG